MQRVSNIYCSSKQCFVAIATQLLRYRYDNVLNMHRIFRNTQ